LRADFLPTNENLPAIIAVCRRLDGIPLAMEFAAARAATLGVREVAARLDDRFRLLTDGRRTALPRHQTLRATLDWSYELLPRLEQRLLRRLAIFPSGFTLEAASAIMADVAGTASTVVEGIAHLVEKSLVVLDGSASAPRWRLLETTRAYALEKLVENDEAGEVARNHAEYHRLLFEQAEAESMSRSKTGWLAAYGREIDDVRAPDEVRRSLVHCLDDVRSALDWAFGPGAAPEVGIALTVAALRLWQELLLMEECHRQVERALASSARMQNGDPHQEMMLFAALGNSTLHTTGDDSALDHAWGNALKRAEQIGDTHHQLRGLNGLALGAMRRSYREALVFARRYQRLAETSFDPQEAMAGDRLTGYVLHVLGEHTGARHLIEGMLTRYIRPTDRRHLAKRNFDERILAKSTLARILWLQGFPCQSIRLANEAVKEAHAVDHIPSLIFAVAYAACPIALLEGDLGLAAPGRDLLRIDLAGGSPWQHPWKQWGAGYNALDRIQQGEMAAGLEMLLDALAAMPRHAFSYRFGLFHAGLAETLLRCQRLDEALKAADAALAQCQILDEHWFEPELIRLRGEIWFARTHDESEAAEQFQAALDLARSQTALAWELRAATSLARLWRSKGRVRSASEVLAPIFSRFTEGFDTADLIAARSLL
jgi:predicted ATPase